MLFSISLLFSLIATCNGILANGSISAPYSTNIPNIDGQWSTASEWNDASENKMINEFGWISYLRLKHNETHVFALLDFVSDQSNSLGDFAAFAFDTINEGGNRVNPDDYQFSFYYAYYFAYYKGVVAQGTGLTPSSWGGISQPEGFILQRGFTNINDPYESKEAHSLFEAAFPLSFLGQNSSIGFYAYVNDSKSGVALEFPVGADILSPGNWGEIVIEKVMVSPSLAPTQSTTSKPTVAPSPSSAPSTSFISPAPSTSIPEFPLCIALLVLMATLLVGTIVFKSKLTRASNNRKLS